MNTLYFNIFYICTALVDLLVSNISAIEFLSLVDCKLKGDIVSVLDAIGANAGLTSLDISGNQMSDHGVQSLAKALQTNTSLISLTWDDNATTLAGLKLMLSALKR